LQLNPVAQCWSSVEILADIIESAKGLLNAWLKFV